MMGFFNSFDNTNCVRLAFQELLHAGDNCSGSGTVATARVRRNNQNVWNAIRRHWEDNRSLVLVLWSLCLMFGFFNSFNRQSENGSLNYRSAIKTPFGCDSRWSTALRAFFISFSSFLI